MAAKTTKPIRVAAEGPTVDGRTITGEQIQQMAKTYNPAKFAARIWNNHLRGILPDSLFAPMGDVLKLEAKQFDAEGVTKWGLYATVSALDNLQAMYQKAANLFWSIELDSNFAGSGMAYLVGLAPTDDPASLWTEPAKFSTSGALEASRHAYPGTLFTAASKPEGNLEFEADPAPPVGSDLLAKIKGLFANNNAQTSDIAKAVEEFAGQVVEKFKEVASVSQFNALQATVDSLKKEAEEDRQAFKALVEKLGNQEAPGNTARPPASGGNQGPVLTDC